MQILKLFTNMREGTESDSNLHKDYLEMFNNLGWFGNNNSNSNPMQKNSKELELFQNKDVFMDKISK